MKKTEATKYYLAAFVAIAVFVIFLATLQNEFLQWDDHIYILENHHIRSLDMDFLKWAFFDFYAGNWHPLTWISHAIDYAIWGLNPMGHHLTSNILHSVNTFVVVILVIRLLEIGRSCASSPGSQGSSGFPLPGGGNKGKAEKEISHFTSYDSRFTVIVAATATGILFGLHPLRVESVAWVSERKDLLCALFFLLSIMSYLSYVSKRASRFYMLALLSFILALLSKPMAVTLPLVLLIVDWYPLERIRSFNTFRSALIEKLPFIALSLGSSVLTLLAQSSGGAVKSLEFAPFSTRLLVAVKSLAVYLWKTLLPINLIPFYPYPSEVSLVSFEYLFSIILVAGITISCILLLKRQKALISVWGYYVIMLIPVLGIVQVGQQSMADRYTYLPGIGPSIIIGLAAAWAWSRIAENRSLLAKYLAVSASVFLVISLSYLTLKQTGIWKNSIVFWSYVIEKEPDRVLLAYLNRGVAFEKAGEIDRAIEDYDKAIAIDPLYVEAYNNRGILYGQSGMLDKALECFDKAIAIDATFADAYTNRGIAYAMTGQYEKALNDFNKAIYMDENLAKAYFNRGSLYLRMGNRLQASSDFRKACDLGDMEGCERFSGL